jgi:GntR family transcriptional regulator of vanillate catabolism
MSARPVRARMTESADDDAGATQTERALLRLRELIVGGELVSGDRVPELALVERLGVSRTPVRAALQRLQEEGLLEPLPGGGFAVRGFDEADIHDAIEVRATMEALAARLAAERGVGATLRHDAQECLQAIDALLGESSLLSAAGFAKYVAHNRQFHALLAEMSGSAIVRRQIERVITLPFASPNAVMVQTAAQARALWRRPAPALRDQSHNRAAAMQQRHQQSARRAAQPSGDAASAGCAPDPARRPLNRKPRHDAPTHRLATSPRACAAHAEPHRPRIRALTRGRGTPLDCG